MDLLDINREPADEEMTALMQEMVNVANAKWKSALDKYTADLCKGIDTAVREGVEIAKELCPDWYESN